MRGLKTDLTTRLVAAGIDAEAVSGPEEDGRLQYHQAAIRIPASDLPGALAAAAAAGFRAPFAARPGQLHAMGRFLPRLTLIRDDDVTARIVLMLKGGGGGLPRALRPSIADIAELDLPAGLVWAYPGFRLLRVVRDRVTGRRDPNSDRDFLGTPEGLISPLLDWLAPSADDVLMDVGCGDGRILTAAARDHGCRAIGVEASPQIAQVARDRIAALPPDIAARIELREGFAEVADLSEATIVFLFMPGFILADLLPGILARALPGTRIIAHEQMALRGLPEPEETKILAADEALTVASLWVKR